MLPRPWDSPGKNTGVGCHFLLQCMKVKSESEVTQSCPTLSDPMDCSLPGSSAHGIFQARVLEWVAIAFSNMLSGLVITFLPRSKRLLISWLQSPSAVILEPPQNKVWHCFHIYFPWSDGTGCHDLSFWMLSFKPTFSLSTFTFIKRLFSSSSLSAIRVVSSVYLRLLIFLPAILIPACVSSSQAFLMMYSAYKLNKQGDNIQPFWHTPFDILDILHFLFGTSLLFHVQF